MCLKIKIISVMLKMDDFGICTNSVGLKPIAVRLRLTALHVRPPGVETPGYSCVVPKGLEVFFYKTFFIKIIFTV